MASTARLGLKQHVNKLRGLLRDIVGMASTARLGLKLTGKAPLITFVAQSEWPLQPVWD